jgi:hypothetical protein
MSRSRSPFALRPRASSCWNLDRECFLPKRTPLAFALALPSAVRLRIGVRSNWASALARQEGAARTVQWCLALADWH